MNEYFNLFILTTIKETNNIPAAFLSSWQIFYYSDKIIFNNQTILYIILDVEDFNYDLPARKTTKYVAKIFPNKVFPVTSMYNIFGYRTHTRIGEGVFGPGIRYNEPLSMPLEDPLNLTSTEGHEGTKVERLLSSRV